MAKPMAIITYYIFLMKNSQEYEKKYFQYWLLKCGLFLQNKNQIDFDEALPSELNRIFIFFPLLGYYIFGLQTSNNLDITYIYSVIYVQNINCITNLPSKFCHMKVPTHQNVISLLSDEEDHIEQKPQKRVKEVSHSQKNANNMHNQHVFDMEQEVEIDLTNRLKETKEKNSQSLAIYEILPQKVIRTFDRTLYRCKICNKKVQNTSMGFSCPKCNKKCHKECMDDIQQCPRCKYNIRLGTYNKNIAPKLKIKEKQRKQQTQTRQKISSQQSSNELTGMTPQKQIHEAQRAINLDHIPKIFNKQVFLFVEKQKRAQMRGNNLIVLPLAEEVIERYEFLQHALADKIKELPEIEELPEHFSYLIWLWNFFKVFESQISQKQICNLAIQNFQQAIKINPITYFLIPLLEMIYHFCQRLKEQTNLLKIFVDVNEQGMLKFISKYFWPMLLIQVIENSKISQQLAEQCQKKREILEKLASKREYEIQVFQQKVEMLHFVGLLVENCPELKNIMPQVIKAGNEEYQKIQKQVLYEKSKLKEKLKMLTEKLQQLRKQKRAEAYPMILSTQPNQYCQYIEEKKNSLLREQNEIKEELENMKQDTQALSYLHQLEYCSKVVYLGKDRYEKLYWYLSETESNDIIFINFKVRREEVQKYEGWGFLHASLIQQLINSLSQTGVNEFRLKRNLEKLINYGLLKTSPSQKSIFKRVKSYICKFKEQSMYKKQKQQWPQLLEAQNFIESAIKEINLSELRKLLAETHKIYNRLVRKQIGIWMVDEVYEYKIKNQKFKSSKDIGKFVSEFAQMMYGRETQKKKTGKHIKNILWKARANYYKVWKKLLEESTKNTEIFMYVMILYLEVVNASQMKKEAKKVSRSPIKKCRYEVDENWSNSSSPDRNQNANESWSRDRDSLDTYS